MIPWLVMMDLTTSPMDITPINLSWSMTGRCRTCFLVINAIHSSTVLSGWTPITLDVIVSRTVVSFDDFPSKATFRA